MEHTLAVHKQTPSCSRIAQSLKRRMALLDLSASELARKAELKPSFIYDILSGKSANPSAVKLARLAEELGVNLSYFIAPLEEEDAARVNPSLLARTSEYAALQTMEIKEIGNNRQVVSVTPAKSEILFHPTWLKQYCDAAPEALRQFKVWSDCMAPTLLPGDRVLVNIRLREPSPPGIFLLSDGFSLFFRRLEVVPNNGSSKIRTLPDNHAYSTHICKREDLHILGRVVWMGRRM